MKNEVHVRTINSQYDKRRDTYDTNLALTVISLTFFAIFRQICRDMPVTLLVGD